MEGEEISFEEIATRAGFDETPEEYTSVTGRERRIFECGWNQFENSLLLNDPDHIAITFIDYLNSEDRGKSSYQNLSKTSKQFLDKIRNQTNTPLSLLKTGPEPDHMIDRT